MTAAAFVSSLVGVKDWSSQNSSIQRWVAAHQLDPVLEIADSLSSTVPTGVPAIAREAILEGVVRTLSLCPSIATAKAALECWALISSKPDFPRPILPPEELASFLAFTQPPAVVDELFALHKHDLRHRETLACLVQETLLRRGEITTAVDQFVENILIEGGHPLAHVPPRLLPQEVELKCFLPSYGPSSAAHPICVWRNPERTAQNTEGTPHTGNWLKIPITEAQRSALIAAVQNWEDESNGSSEVGVFCFSSDLSQDTPSPSELSRLEMDCFQGTAADDHTIRHLSFANALAVLFSAASTGGAYNHGLGGAYGRLAAWHSAAAMAGLPPATSLEDVASEAERCRWMEFESKGEWFYQVAWDVGLMTLRSDARTLAVLAATDTD